jgi:hypothetical protein
VGPQARLILKLETGMAKDQKFKIEVEDDKGVWHDERGADGAPLIFDDEGAARAKLSELYPVLVQMERYGGGKRTRVIRVLVDEDDWPTRPGS